MSDPIINGDGNAQFNSEFVTFGPQAGEYSMKIEGPADKVRAYVSQLMAVGASGVFRCDSSPLATLEFSVGSVDSVFGSAADETPFPVWELVSNTVEKNLLAPNTPTANYFTSAEVDEIEKYLADRTRTKPTYSGANAAAKGKLLELLVFGQESRVIFQPTIKVSRAVSYSYTVKASIANAGRIFTTATLQAQEAIPATILFNLPNDTYNGGSGFTNTDFVYGWLKCYPTVQSTGSNRFSMSQEWQYGLWPTVVYGAAL